MDMLNRAILFLLALAALSTTQAQNRRGIKMAAGVGHINNYVYPGDGEFRTQPALAGQLGLFQEWNATDRLVLGAELLGSYVRGKDIYRQRYPYPSFPPTASVWYNDRETKDVFYLSVPLWIGWQVNRWTFNVGGQASLFLGGVRNQDPGLESIHHVSNWQEGRVQNARVVEVGPRAAMICNLNAKWALEASYYHGATNAFFTAYDVRTNIRHGLVGVRWAMN